MIVDNGRAYIANGGDPAIVNLGRGAKVYTAEQTRRILFESGIRSAAMGLDTLANGPGYSYANYLNGLGDGITDVIEAVLEGEGEGEGEGEEEKKKGGGGGGGNKPSAKGSWDKLTKIIPYILNRVNRALEKQSEIIDKQIQALEDEKSRKEQQNQLEEYQKAVLDAENDLNEAMTNRTVRYLDDNGQRHWWRRSHIRRWRLHMAWWC